MTLVLASGSPRRKELLVDMGIPHRVEPSTIDERTISADHPRTFALRAAFAKASDVASRTEEDTWVLGADTVVTRAMILLGKPYNEDNAREILRALSGQQHEVVTGIALVQPGGASFLRAISTYVWFRDLTDFEIDRYVRTGEPMDKAGAYGIQGKGGDLIERIAGDYYNVVGLPCRALKELMEEADLDTGEVNVPRTPERWR